MKINQFLSQRLLSRKFQISLRLCDLMRQRLLALMLD